ncbi:unnamed protein product [Oppiella nova]|uniref:GH16 domain-containing protein n=1 Tax=Oppiella nova TaxID=334625 RepID=A0A7R9LYH4_9ACAR|nr:unnamed protein product [Oppiella nova]CAG2168123.1 unnamed protein product [Oppiella nova]
MISIIANLKQLNIVWRDEFEGQALDRDKWDVDNEFVKTNCKGNWMHQLHCNLDHPKNLQSTHGCLAITAARETNPYILSNNKNFSSAMITSKKGWPYGRIEIRAVLPNGKMLRPVFIMIHAAGQTKWALDGQIDVMTNIQDSSLYAGAHYGLLKNYKYTGAEYNAVCANLQEFHTYAVEWNETHIQWFFGDNKHSEDFDINKTLTTNYTKKGQPFDKAFKLTLSLGVGGDADYLFPGMSLTERDYMSWKCSAIIIDYVRVYEWVDNHTVHSGHISSVGDRTSSVDICESVMSYIRSPNHTDGDSHTTPEPIEPTFTLTLTSIVSIVKPSNWMHQLHCNLDHPKNLQSTHGCLAITAARETNPYILSNNKNFSSAMITSKKGWSYGRFEIRAVLPNGKMLRPAFIMIPTAEQTNWPLDGQIDVMTNIQGSSLYAGAHYGLSQNYGYIGAEYNAISANLQDFHTYAVEWNETHIQWFFDDNKYSEDFDINKMLTTDYTKNGQPFDKAFKFILSLGVGGDADYLFPGMTLTESDYMSWKCSAIIIDYVRVYEWVDIHTVHSGHISSVGDRTSSADICESVMSYIRSPNHTDGDSHTTPGPIEPTFTLTLTSSVSIVKPNLWMSCESKAFY